MELYHNNMSVCAQKVRLVLREKELAPLEHHLNLRAGEATRPEYLKLNPNGVVPTLVDRGRVIVESTAICEYLEDAYPEFPMRPENLADRAEMRAWTIMPDAGLHHACGISSFAIAFRHQMLALPQGEIDRLLAEKPDPQVRENLRATIERGIEAPHVGNALRTFQRAVQRMAARLGNNDWLAGDQYSLADAALLPYVCRFENLKMGWLWQETPQVDAWLARCTARRNFSGIRDYLDTGYLEVMARSGAQLEPQLRALLART